MCFLSLGDEFSATALLSEAARIKNTYTDGTKLYAYKIKYILRATDVIFMKRCLHFITILRKL